MRYEIGQANRLGNREINQDRFGYFVNGEEVLLVLADGMGGRPGGDLAAEAVIDTAARAFEGSPRPLRDTESFLRNLIVSIHEEIKALEVTRDLPAAPGSTGVLCLIQDGVAQWAHIGDSRLYLFRGGVPLYRTTDHSYVEQLYQAGKISRDELTNHPQRSYVTQCLGCMPHIPHPEISRPTPLMRDDVLLLCTDGLWSPLDDAQLGAMLNDRSLDEVLNHMAEEAERISYPTSDNISAIALRFFSTEPSEQTQSAAGSNTPATRAADALQSAIEQIENAIREYGGEMDDKPEKK